MDEVQALSDKTMSGTNADIAGLSVSLQGVGKTFDSGVVALGPLDLKVRKGEFVALVGPSGCGKSTALRLIAGLSAPTAGSVQVSHHGDALHPGQGIGFVF